MIPAPPGWGYVPGVNLVPAIDDLPELPMLPLLQPGDRARALTSVLMQHPGLLVTLEPPVLLRRYPSIQRQRLSEIIENAKLGRIPGGRGKYDRRRVAA